MRRALVIGMLVSCLVGTVHAADDAAALRTRGDAAFQRQDWETAAAAYRPLSELAPTDGGVWYRLGYALHALGRLDEAVVAHEKAATFPRLAPRALYNLACAQALQGERDLALTTLRRALDAGFRSPTRLREDADLAGLADEATFQALEQRALPPAQRDVYRQFDFWVGTWDVTNAGGQPAGRNVITLEEKGMLLVEHWTNTQGATGTSINFHDAADGRWHQIWVDPSGEVTRYAGTFHDGAMHFEGTAAHPDGRRGRRRMVFTPRADGTVRQVIQVSPDGGATWTVDFDGLYTRVDDASGG